MSYLMLYISISVGHASSLNDAVKSLLTSFIPNSDSSDSFASIFGALDRANTGVSSIGSFPDPVKLQELVSDIPSEGNVECRLWSRNGEAGEDGQIVHDCLVKGDQTTVTLPFVDWKIDYDSLSWMDQIGFTPMGPLVPPTETAQTDHAKYVRNPLGIPADKSVWSAYTIKPYEQGDSSPIFHLDNDITLGDPALWEKVLDEQPELMNQLRLYMHGQTISAEHLKEYLCADASSDNIDGCYSAPLNDQMLKMTGRTEWDDVHPRAFDFGLSILPPLYYLEHAAIKLDHRLNVKAEEAVGSIPRAETIMTSMRDPTPWTNTQNEALIKAVEENPSVEIAEDDAFITTEVLPAKEKLERNHLSSGLTPEDQMESEFKKATIANSIRSKRYKIHGTMYLNEYEDRNEQDKDELQRLHGKKTLALDRGIGAERYLFSIAEADLAYRQAQREDIEAKHSLTLEIIDEKHEQLLQANQRSASLLGDILDTQILQYSTDLELKATRIISKQMPRAHKPGANAEMMMAALGWNHQGNIVKRTKRQARSIQLIETSLNVMLEHDLQLWQERRETDMKIYNNWILRAGVNLE